MAWSMYACEYQSKLVGMPVLFRKNFENSGYAYAALKNIMIYS